MNPEQFKAQVHAFVRTMHLLGIVVRECTQEWLYDGMQFGLLIEDIKCHALVCVCFGELEHALDLNMVTHRDGFSAWTVVNTPGRGGDPDDSDPMTIHESLSLAPVLAKTFDFIVASRIDNASEVTFGQDEELSEAALFEAIKVTANAPWGRV
jgi:hypothetical protein